MGAHIRHISLLAVLAFLLFGTSGCTSNRPLYGGANKPPLLKAKALGTFNYTDSKLTNYYLNAYSRAVSLDTNSNPRTEINQQATRNAILNDLMSIVDSNYHQFENNFRNDRSVQAFGADIATLGLTAAATVVGAAETKTILSAIATGVVGVNAAIDKDFFQNNTVQALQLQMRAQRAAVEIKLNSGMTNSITAYPLQNGIRDIVDYYYAGSLNDALLALVQTSGTAAQTNQATATKARASISPSHP